MKWFITYPAWYINVRTTIRRTLSMIKVDFTIKDNGLEIQDK